MHKYQVEYKYKTKIDVLTTMALSEEEAEENVIGVVEPTADEILDGTFEFLEIKELVA